jgi:hypothetical protein
MLDEREKAKALQVYQADILWAIASGLKQGGNKLPRFSELVDQQKIAADSRNGDQIIDDVRGAFAERQARRRLMQEGGNT